MEKNKLLIAIISVVIIVAALAGFFCTRGKRDIPGIWESDIFTNRSTGKQGQNILIITSSGRGCSISIDPSSASVNNVKFGTFKIESFRAVFQEDGTTGIFTDYDYNPITNHLSCGDRTYSKTDKYQELYDMFIK